MALLEMKVGPAHPAVPAGDDHRPGLDNRRQIELLDREGATDVAQHNRAGTPRRRRTTR
jgi:hypothetical protein